jgi:hypothetical protein
VREIDGYMRIISQLSGKFILAHTIILYKRFSKEIPTKTNYCFKNEMNHLGEGAMKLWLSDMMKIMRWRFYRTGKVTLGSNNKK